MKPYRRYAIIKVRAHGNYDAGWYVIDRKVLRAVPFMFFSSCLSCVDLELVFKDGFYGYFLYNGHIDELMRNRVTLDKNKN